MVVLSNLSVRGKVLLVVAFSLLLEAVVAATGLFYLRASNRALTVTVEVETEAIQEAARVRVRFLDMIIAEKNMILSQDEGEVSRYNAVFDTNRREVEQRLRKLRDIAGPSRAAPLDAFATALNEYLVSHERIRDMKGRNEDAQVVVMSTGVSREHADRARAALLTLMDNLDASLAQRKLDNDAQAGTAMGLMGGTLVATLMVTLGFGLVITRAITKGLSDMVTVADAIALGKLDNEIAVVGRDEAARLAVAVGKMQSCLRESRAQAVEQDWLKTGLTRVNDIMRGELEIPDLARKVIGEMTTYLDGKAGAFHIMGEEQGSPCLLLVGTYALERRKGLSNRFRLGEGLVGQAALEKKQILISHVPDDYMKVVSALGETAPRQVCVTPLLLDERVVGVIEIATLDSLSDLHLEYLSRASPGVAITIESARGRERLRAALEQSHQLTEELQVQQEELQAANEELEEQTQRLTTSEERLRAQQEEMAVTNVQLEESNDLLQRQKRDVERARRDIADKAEELALASKYKSEFLANMSHELRTPLNSLLLLARGFADNRDRTLSESQVDAARVIFQSGNDLLSLINEILDLSKIEAGRMDLKPSRIDLGELAETTRDGFARLALERKLELSVTVARGAPETVVADRQRVMQVVRNLVSNALKFTESGGVSVVFGPPSPEAQLHRSGLARAGTLAITVVDTGIGIAPDHHKLIFEAFQQADGGISRKYGGTGLGLSISRELVRLMGGEIQLQSAPGSGSTFTVFLPAAPPGDQRESPTAASASPPDGAMVQASADPGPAPISVGDDRGSIQKGDRLVLIVEDDPRFAVLLSEQCRRHGMKCLVAGTGEEGVELAQRFLPRGIILDIRLPGLDGWGVLQILKDTPATRHIPVHIMSVEEPSNEAMRKGAVGHLRKPVTLESIDEALRKIEDAASGRLKKVLVVEDADDMRQSLVALIADEGVHVDEAASAKQAIDALRSQRYDCMVLDLGLGDMDGGQLLKHLETDGGIEVPPVIVHTARELTREEEMELRAYAESIVIKDVRSEERLLDEVSLFLHRVVDEMPSRKRQVITELHESDGALRGKKVMVVDDDMRTVYALTKILSDRGVSVVKAENGERALRLLAEGAEVDLVLMDVMMPVLDGLDATRRIRADERLRKLPVIMLTAKAMKGDQERCMAAGASDYMTKPIDQDRLLSMMRVWLYR